MNVGVPSCKSKLVVHFLLNYYPLGQMSDHLLIHHTKENRVKFFALEEI